MITAIGEYVGSKVVTAILVVSGGGAMIWFWNHPEDLQAIWQTIKYVLVWMGIVLVLPWATFFLTTWALAKDSNVAIAIMLLGYAMIDVIVAFCLIGRVGGLGFMTWMVLLLGFLSSAVYNFKVCEYHANRLEEF